MTAVYTCPVCGAVNSAEAEFCQQCQSRLRPSVDMFKGVDEPIQPGQAPTKKNTAELEPILPQWLRDARERARRIAEEEARQAAQKTQPRPDAAEPDLLAGLTSQSRDEEEEIPEWLASITGTKQKPKKTEAEEPSDVHWVELGKPSDFMQEGESSGIAAAQPPSESAEADEGGLPPWLAGAASENEGVDELSEWLRQADAQAHPLSGEPPPKMEAGKGWPEASSLSASETVPDWLKKMQEEESAREQPPVESDADWLKGLQSEVGQEAPVEIGPEELPSWLKAEEPAPPARTEEPAAQEPEAGPGDVPDWLKAAAPTASVFEESAAQEPASAPDWLSSLQAAAGEAASSAPAFAADSREEIEMPAPTPAFEPEALSGENMDALFTELPDWLSSAEAKAGVPPSEGQAISPGELPSWVQAMRPVETSEALTSASDQTLESHGALAGLQGVLPAVPGIGPSSKPKAYSIKLQVTEEQQAHAALLEQILAAEAAPVPIETFSPLSAQRGLRWLLAALIGIVVFAVLGLQTRLFAMPAGEPNEIRDARLIAEAIPENAPVLVVIDYEPALAGEMEAAAAPLLDHAILLKHPRLVFISTSPTGGLLAEHLIANRFDCAQCVSLSDHNYQRNTQYVNLGYLPGGLAGVRAFAQNPRAAAPLDIDLAPAWSGAVLQGITSLSQFAALIVVTDNAESARAWIEQTAPERGAAPMLMVSSAQAAPMIRPYYESRQVSGLVSGLYGGAIFEQNNAGRPGLARNYWDAYSLGMILAAILIVLGGLWNLALGLRDRAAALGK